MCGMCGLEVMSCIFVCSWNVYFNTLANNKSIHVCAQTSNHCSMLWTVVPKFLILIYWDHFLVCYFNYMPLLE